MTNNDSEEYGQGTHRPPRDDLVNTSPTANLDGLERRVCPNCRNYFDAGEDSERVFCGSSCRHRHEGGVLLADGGQPAEFGSDTPRGIVWADVPDECPDCGGEVVVDDQGAMYCETDGCAWEPLEAPMECPECGDDHVVGDGRAFECEFCGFTWGRPSGRGAANPNQSLEPEVNDVVE